MSENSILTDTELGFYPIDCPLEHVAVYLGNVGMKPHRACYNIADSGNNTVVAGSSIIVEFNGGPSGQCRIIVLEYLTQRGRQYSGWHLSV
jgi:hypothetical protein